MAKLKNTAGEVLFSEPWNVLVDADGNINITLGNNTPDGLPPDLFQSGTSRLLDVVDSSEASVLIGGRLPVTAVAFALSPGPAGLPDRTELKDLSDQRELQGRHERREHRVPPDRREHRA